MTITRLVVGLDGSPHADAAMTWAVDLARTVGTEVVVVHAVGLLEHLHGSEDTWSARLRDTGVRHHAIRRDGNPVTVLLDVAREVDADLVVVGSRGLGGHPQLLLGSTSTQVAQRSTRPVVIVPSARPVD